MQRIKMAENKSENLFKNSEMFSQFIKKNIEMIVT